MHRHPVAALLGACALLVIVVFAPLPRTTVLGIRMLHDFAHAPILGSVALLLLYAIRSYPRLNSLGSAWQHLIALLGAVAFGGLTELAQIPVGRDASWFDVRSDLLGAAAFLALFSVVDPRTRSRAHRVLASVAGIGLLVFHALPVALAALAYERRAVAFPVLADFTRHLDLFFVEPQRARIEHRPMAAPWAASPGESTLQVDFGSGPWPGLNFLEPAPDWRSYAALALDLTNPADVPLTLVLRVHDVRHDNRREDRFNRTFQVPPRTRTVLRVPLAEIESAPRARSLDIGHVAGLILFRADSSAAPQMDVSKVWLE
jgi:VanZ family protein